MRLARVCVLAVVAVIPAVADPISFEVSGILSSVSPSWNITPGFGAGTAFTATITYDPTYYGTYGCGSTYCQYTTFDGAIALFSVQVGSDTVSSIGFSNNSIGITNQTQALGGDSLIASSFATNPFISNLPSDFGFDSYSVSDVSYQLSLYDSTGTIFPSVGLPSSINPSGFDSGEIQMQFSVGGGSEQLLLDGNITTATDSSVPEPGTLLLTTAGLLAAGIAYRRKRLTL
jgi:hypothetical protein